MGRWVWVLLITFRISAAATCGQETAITIRPLKSLSPEELVEIEPQIIALSRELEEEGGLKKKPTLIAVSEESLKRVIQHDKRTGYSQLAFSGKRLIAFALAYYGNREDVVNILKFGVHKDFRTGWLAKDLFVDLCEAAIVSGHEDLRASVLATNDRAINVYRWLGFHFSVDYVPAIGGRMHVNAREALMRANRVPIEKVDLVKQIEKNPIVTDDTVIRYLKALTPRIKIEIGAGGAPLGDSTYTYVDQSGRQLAETEKHWRARGKNVRLVADDENALSPFANGSVSLIVTGRALTPSAIAAYHRVLETGGVAIILGDLWEAPEALRLGMKFYRFNSESFKGLVLLKPFFL